MLIRVKQLRLLGGRAGRAAVTLAAGDVIRPPPARSGGGRGWEEGGGDISVIFKCQSSQQTAQC